MSKSSRHRQPRMRAATAALVASLSAPLVLAACADERSVPADQPDSMAPFDLVIRDGLTLAAVADAIVEIRGRGTWTADQNGRIRSGDPGSPSTAIGDGRPPPRAAFTSVPWLTVRAPGYLTSTREDDPPSPFDSLGSRGIDVGNQVVIRLYPAVADERTVARALEGRTDARALRDDPADSAMREDVRAFLRGELDEGALLAASDGSSLRSRSDPADAADVAGRVTALAAPPATIRVWRRSIDGASESCSGRIDVIDLEDYIKGVLPHEWIPSWHDESLKAGAVAIRTYAWNWIARGGKYDCADLDDTTRSQVYADDRTERASAAVDATAHQGIVRGDSLVSGEYSAEHGSPTADGIDDALCVGQARYGHGRGMCQWGSQRWANDGRDYRWIAEHYFPGSAVEGGEPATPAWAAEVVALDYPTELVAGADAQAWIDLRNTGSATWTTADTALVTTMPSGRPGRLHHEGDWLATDRPTDVDSDTAPGEVGRFGFAIRAPAVTTVTAVEETLGLVHGSEPFGPPSLRIEVLVTPGVGSPPTCEEEICDPPPDGSDGGLLDGRRRPTAAAVHNLEGGCSLVPSSWSVPAPNRRASNPGHAGRHGSTRPVQGMPLGLLAIAAIVAGRRRKDRPRRRLRELG